MARSIYEGPNLLGQRQETALVKAGVLSEEEARNATDAQIAMSYLHNIEKIVEAEKSRNTSVVNVA